MQRLDVRGLVPPAPILEVRRALSRLAAGTVLEVVGDDAGLVRDLPAYCTQAGHALLMVRPGEGRSVIFEIARGESESADTEPEGLATGGASGLAPLAAGGAAVRTA